MHINADWGRLEVALQLAAEDAGAELPADYAKAATYELIAWVKQVEEANGTEETALLEAVRAWCERRAVSRIAHEWPEITDLATLPDFWPLNPEPWHNDAVCFFRYRTANRIGEFWMQATALDHREFEEAPRFGIAVYVTEDSETPGERVASFTADTLEGFGFDVAERVVLLCTKPHVAATACRFQFNDGPVYAGWTDGTTWNGWANVWCAKDAFDAIVDTALAAGDTEGAQQMREIEPDEHGRYALAYGYTASVVTDPA